jgi:DNA invertase Pin-like site-specific DNA recombinase
MIIGYARTSTLEQEAGLDAQVRDLKAAGCERLFTEQISSVARREQLEAAIDFARDGDVIIVTKLDRLARSVIDLLNIKARLDDKGVELRILAMNFDSSTPTGKLVLNVFGAIAQFEREMMLERQKEGIAKAKAEGKYKGRAPTAMAKAGEILALKGQGLGPTAIAKRLGISVRSVYRALD